MRLLFWIAMAMFLVGGCAESTTPPAPESSTPTPSEPATTAYPPATVPNDADPSDEEMPDSELADAKPAKVDAEQLLGDTLAQAATQDKRVMVHLGAPW